MAVTLMPVGARADDRPADDRPLRLSWGAGWSGAVLGPPTHGPVVYAAVLPGGRLGRAGGHLELRGISGPSPYWVVGGLTYEAAAARPHLAVDLRAEAGAVLSDRTPIVGGGARWHVWLVGPVAVGIDTAAHIWLEGVLSELVLSAALALEVAL